MSLERTKTHNPGGLVVFQGARVPKLNLPFVKARGGLVERVTTVAVRASTEATPSCPKV